MISMLKNPLLLQWFRFNIRCEAQPRLLRCGSAPLSMKHGLLHWIFMHILSIIVRVSVPKPFSVCALVLFPFPCFPHLSPHLSSVLCRFVTCAVPSEGKLDQEYYVDSGESKAPLNLSTKPTQNSKDVKGWDGWVICKLAAAAVAAVAAGSCTEAAAFWLLPAAWCGLL